jgi:hypothetical protein
MLRPLVGIGAAALMMVGSYAYAQRPGGFGRPASPPPAAPGIQNPGFQNPGFQNPGFGNPGLQPNQNPGWNNWNQNRIWIDAPFASRWVTPGPRYGGYNSIWYTPYGNWNVPMSGRASFLTPGYVTPEVLATIPAQVSGRETGMQVTQVFDRGGAKQADLRPGDIILGVGKTRTQSFEALQAALVGVSDTEIVFINKDNNRVERMPIKVDNGKIGVEVVPVTL